MTTDVQQPTPDYALQPALPQIPQLVPPPAPDNVVHGLATLREACAQWAPVAGQTRSNTEAKACDVILGRNDEAYMMLGFGVAATVLAIGYTGLCRRAVNCEASSKAEEVLAYIPCALGGFLPGLIAGALAFAEFGDSWTIEKSGVSLWGCAVAGSILLMTLRWVSRRKPSGVTYVRKSESPFVADQEHGV